MNDTAQTRLVEDAASRRRFLDLPRTLYAGDPNWVPPLRSAHKKLFAGRTAFNRFADLGLFLVERGGHPVGRVAAIRNHNHNEHYGDRTGFFGFFECRPDDPEAATALIRAAEAWLADQGLDTLRGPVNPSMNAECGLLVEGFDSPPVALMPYNHPTYGALLEGAGLSKLKDLYAYLIRREKTKPGTPAFERLVRTSELLHRRHPEVKVRTIDLAHYKEDLMRFMGVFEEARRNNWGYVPVTKDEVLESAKDLKMVADPDIIVLAEVDGKPAGASLAIPDINQILARIGGRLFPFGFITFLRARRKIDTMRIFGIGAIEKYRHLGVTALLLVETIQRGLKKQYQTCEASWVLEDNVMSNRTIERVLHPERYKTYRLYEKKIHV